MNAVQAWRKFSGRSQSAKPPPPPRSGDVLTEHGPDAGPDASRGIILYVEDITVSFDGFRALNALTLYIETGELRCIIGPNGAGKTTMMDVITGKTRPDSGSESANRFTSSPNQAEPRSGRVRPVMTSIIVVLPAPFGPMMQRSSPGST